MLFTCAILISGLAVAEEPQTGWDWAALPTPNYSSDDGVGYGAYGTLFNYGPMGSGDDPYKAKIAVLIYQTTKLYRDHYINLDFPGLLGTELRWDLKVGWEAWNHAWYFGRGNFLPRLQDQVLAQLGSEDYYEYALDSVKAYTNLRIPVRGPWELLFNYRGRYIWLDLQPGSLLEQEQPTGVEGGFFSQLSVGVLLDTRDKEPSPSSGVFSELSVRGAHAVLGSAWSLLGFNLTDRRFISLAAEDRLVLANRFIADYRLGDVPFFEDWVLGGSQFVQIGGSLTLQGLNAGRYRGDLVLLTEPELRWTFVAAHIGANTLDIMAVPFANAARIWALDKDEPDALTHLHYSAGLGARFAWNETFLVRLDMGFGLEEYIPLDMSPDSVSPEDVERGLTMGIYMVFDHPY